MAHSLRYTKAVGSDKREDITHLYKHPECENTWHQYTPSSDSEQIIVETASRNGSKPNRYPHALANDVTFQVTVKGERPWVGEDARLSFTLNDSSSEKNSIIQYSQVAIMYFSGVLKGIVLWAQTQRS